jgi:hypothetical protein
MKRGIYSASVMFLLVLSLLSISLASSQSTEGVRCVDTDFIGKYPSENLYKKGTVTLGEETATDKCFSNEEYILEYSCFAEAHTEGQGINGLSTKCPEGYYCPMTPVNEGRCVPITDKPSEPSKECNNNGKCNTEIGETCKNCPKDCGICETEPETKKCGKKDIPADKCETKNWWNPLDWFSGHKIIKYSCNPKGDIIEEEIIECSKEQICEETLSGPVCKKENPSQDKETIVECVIEDNKITCG